MTDGVLPLIRSGVIDNSLKVVEPGKSVASLALGSRELYDYMDHNPDIIIKDVAWTNDPFRIAQNPAVMSINSCLEIDLTARFAPTRLARKYTPEWAASTILSTGHPARVAENHSLPCLPPPRKGRQKSSPCLHRAGVVTTRFQTNYVVTEYGIADLRGLSIAERAKALIGLAAPEFRDDLSRAAAERFGHAFTRLQ